MRTKVFEEHNKERLKAVSGFLRQYRISSGYSQLELSTCSGVHRNTIGRYESLSAENITLLTVFEVADALELDVNQIFLDIE